MKNHLILFTAGLLIFLSACQKEEVVDGETLESRNPPSKITVCHLNEDGIYEPRDVPVPSLNGHLSHGDFLPDADGDGYSMLSACTGSKDDCDDNDATIYPGAPEIPDDGIDQDCSGGDSTSLVCECFSTQDLQDLYNYTPWPFGWWSDVPGCKAPPYDQLLELWITNVGQPAQNFNFSAQAGTINGNWFASSARFNHITGQFDLLCGGYTTQQIAEPCRQILSNFIQQLRSTHPDWDYCVRFP